MNAGIGALAQSVVEEHIKRFEKFDWTRNTAPDHKLQSIHR